MVVDYLSMSSVNFAIPDFCSLIPVGSLRQSRRVRNRRVTPRPCLVMGSRLSASEFYLSATTEPAAEELRSRQPLGRARLQRLRKNTNARFAVEERPFQGRVRRR